MDINVSTKFNIGDEIYLGVLYYDSIFRPEGIYTVRSIKVCTNLEHQNIEYELMAHVDEGIYIGTCSEDRCFSTKEECQKWCDKQNC